MAMTQQWATARIAELKAHLAESREHYIAHTAECAVCVFNTGPWCKAGLYRHATWCREAQELRQFARRCARSLP